MSFAARRLPVTNLPGSIAAGGTAQNVYAKERAPKNGFEFQNTSDTDMYLAWDKDASATNGIRVPAGGMYYRPGQDQCLPEGRMSVFCATTGKTFVCNLW